VNKETNLQEEMLTMNAGYLLTRSARYFPEKTAFVIDDQSITYKELNRRVNKLANSLLSLGLKKGDRVGLLYHNSLGYLEGYLALYKAGLVWVRLNSRLHPDEINQMIVDSGTQALITAPQFIDMIEKMNPPVKWIIQKGGPKIDYDQFLEKGSEDEPKVDVLPDDLADLWYTSGTTGTPKGIMITHRNILSCTMMLLTDTYDIGPDDKLLTVGALSHAGSVRVLPFIARGATNYLHPHFDAVKALKEIHQSKITDISTVPTILITLMDHPERPKYDLSSIKRITYGGSPMPVERIKDAVKLFGPVLIQSFGQAESIITITHLPRQEHITHGDPDRERRLGSAGREYAGVQVRVVDENDNVLGPNEVGEIVTSSDLVMKGYWNQPDKTAEALRGGWLHTGDIGYLDEGGYLFLIDRQHDKIITGGLNVFPREVEEILATHPAVAQVVVFGADDPVWGEAVTAAVILRDGTNATEEDLMKFAKENVAGYKKPKKIHVVREYPKNLFGKVVRRDLKKMLAGK
jgi:acyl-CoA synthetase (AMP-forming)/AMP-acid ligase II